MELMTAVRVVQFSACRPVLVEPVLKGVGGGGSDDAVWQAVPRCYDPVGEVAGSDVQSAAALGELQAVPTGVSAVVQVQPGAV
jgi:hypothetical protein